MTGFLTTADLAEYQASDPQSFIDAASAVVRDFCGWHITPSVTVTLLLDGSGSDILPLPSLYVTNLTAVSIPLWGGEVIDDTNLVWSQSGYVRRRYGWWPWEPRSVALTMTHGYDEVPEAVKAVTLGIAQRALEVKATALRVRAMGPFSEQMFDVTGVGRGAGASGGYFLTTHDRNILGAYAIPVTA